MSGILSSVIEAMCPSPGDSGPRPCDRGGGQRDSKPNGFHESASKGRKRALRTRGNISNMRDMKGLLYGHRPGVNQSVKIKDACEYELMKEG